MGANAKAKKGKLPTLSFNSTRRMGIEIEINAMDGQNRPEGRRDDPVGMEILMNEVGKHVEEGVQKSGYQHTQGNATWVVKPDSSCGMEVVSPPIKGSLGVTKVVRLVDAFRKNPEIKADRRCSLHAHVEVKDLSQEQIAAVIAWWIKCEPVIMDAMPSIRKRNKYCQFLGLLPLFQVDTVYPPAEIIERVGKVKYYSINAYMMLQTGYERMTLEFRVGEHEMCKQPYLVKNWLRFVLHFIEMAAAAGLPKNYEPGDRWSGLCWLEPEDVFDFLGFGNNPPKYELSNGLVQVRDWFLARLMVHQAKHAEPGLPRYIAHRQVQEMAARFLADGHEINPDRTLHPEDLETALYDESLRF